MSWIKWAWSLASGVSLTTYVYMAAFIAFGAWTFHWYNVGYSVADTMWKNKQLEARIEKLELEKKIQLEADKEDEKADAEMEAENAELKKKVDDYEERLKTRPDTERCVLTDDDIDGLP